jgi:hypothetical protein
MSNTTSTSIELQSPLSQAEKRALIKNDQKVREGPTTYKDFESAFANEGRGGRFAKSSDDQAIKPLPPNSPWSGAQPQPGDELPLGYDINDVPDLGFPLNKQSVVQAPALTPLAAVETATDERGGAGSAPQRSSSSLSTTEK